MVSRTPQLKPRMPRRTNLIKLGVLTVALALWEIAARYNWYNPSLAPPPSVLLRFAATMAERPETLADIGSSLRRVFVGFTIATTLALLLAMTFHRLRALRPYLEFWVDLFRPIPPVAWIPFAILMWGIGDAPAYFIVVLGTFFPIFTNAVAGLSAVDDRHLLIAKSLGAKPVLVWRRVTFPTLLTYLLPGMRAGLGVGWMSVITAEMIGAQSGLGYRMQVSRMTLQIENIYLGMIAVGVIGYLMNSLLIRLEHRLIPWRDLSANNKPE